MNSHKRIFRTTALAALLFAAIAVGPELKHAVTRAHAGKAPAVVTLACSPANNGFYSLFPNFYGVFEVHSSDPSVTLPTFAVPGTPGEACPAALIGLIGQGFRVVEFTGYPSPLATGFGGANASPVPMPVYQWVLARGEEGWSSRDGSTEHER
jgi:hypothetical protein